MEIDKELYNEIKAYCEINSLKPREYVHNLLKKAFMEDKYGKAPGVLHIEPNEKLVEKAVEEIKETKEQPQIRLVENQPKVVKTIKRKLNE